MMKKQVTFVGNLLNDGSRSMHMYLNDVQSHLHNYTSNLIQPTVKMPHNYLRIFFKLFIYPFYCLFDKSDLYHIVDHSYAHLAFFLRKKVVVTCHDLIPLILKNQSSFVSRLLFKVYLLGLKRADYIFVVSDQTKKDLVRLLRLDSKKIIVNYNFLSYPLKKPSLHEKNAFLQKHGLTSKKIMLSVGGPFEYKNVSLILSAFRELPKEYVLLKVGDFTLKDAQFVKQFNLQKRIIHLTQISDSLLSLCYSVSNCLVFPSFYEGFGKPVLEAMSAGCPVITTKNGSLSEVGGSAVRYTSETDSKELVSNILSVVNDKTIYDDLIKKGLNQSKIFSIETHINLLEKYYDKLLK